MFSIIQNAFGNSGAKGYCRPESSLGYGPAGHLDCPTHTSKSQKMKYSFSPKSSGTGVPANSRIHGLRGRVRKAVSTYQL